MSNIRISFGTWRLSMNPHGLTLTPHGGTGRHLQVYFSPNPTGRMRGLWTPHVKDPKTGTVTWISRARFRDVVAALEQLKRDLLARYAMCLRRVDLAQLVAEEWVTVIVPPERYRAFLEEHARGDARRYRITEETLEDLRDLTLRCIAPVEEVLKLPEGKQCVQIMRINDSGKVERAQLQFLPASPHHDDTGAGWFLLPWEWLDDQAFAGILAPHVQPGVFKALRILGTALNLLVDSERIAQLEALASRHWTSKSNSS